MPRRSEKEPLLSSSAARPAAAAGGGIDDPRRRKWELVVCTCLAISYSLTVSTSRNALFTAKSQINDEFGGNAYGNINSVGYATYGVGKLVYGVVVDLPSVGGRVAFLYCLVGTGVFTSLMSLAGSELHFTLAWGMARATQASGWIAMVKVVAAWTPAWRLGRVMSGLALAAYLGDFATRLTIGAVLAAGVHWRSIFWLSGVVIGCLLLVTLCLLHPSPEGMGFIPVPPNPHQVAGVNHTSKQQQQQQPPPPPPSGCCWRRTTSLRLLCGSAEFWTVCLLSVCLQTGREAFNTNSADLLSSQGASDAAAAALSSAFPLMGVPACIFFGWLVDRYQRRRNGEILVCSLTLLLVTLGFLCGWLWEPGLGLHGMMAKLRSDWVVAVLLLLTGFTLIGPYSLLAGVFAGTAMN
jgi:sugar phosphate permease